MHKTLWDSPTRDTSHVFRRNTEPEDQLSEAAMARIRRRILRKFLARVRGKAAPRFSWPAQAAQNL